ncbi:AIPR family protein [Stenotrophomonas indicatrix]|uniref:AIPR family protein n=1 Tax=Stenotrophomonas indicatrix TaxID=2045451 RepID=UPI001CBAA0E3|nr:AIPR family protein [Stenotrophomonas indicatrix]
MNSITLNSMLNEFSAKNSLTGSESIRFEKFTSHSILANDYHDSFDVELVGTGDCIGVDAVAIAISDIIVYNVEAAKTLTSGQFDVTINFIQTKSSASLDLGDYLKFLQTVFIFFTSSIEMQPKELRAAFEVKEHIYSKASKLRSAPELRLNYAYAGDGTPLNDLFKIQIDTLVGQISDLPYLFSKVTSRVVGADELGNLYKESLNRTTKNLMFQRHVALPKLESASAAYLGVSRCIDYIELLKNHDGNINKGLFYDNVRDFLGAENGVNKDIESTIKTEGQRNLFSVLNNGVTLVARRVVPSGDKFEISGFQVVNGCQTSHVLFNNREHVTPDMYLTVKLIETDDVDLSSSVTKATNSQSVVLREAFATIKPYHRKLEDFFKAMNEKGHRFFYERRPHQYDDDDAVLRSEVVSAPILIKSFVSVALEEPHKVHFYYGQILKDYNSGTTTLVFDDSHHPGLYFVSHVIASRAKELASKKGISSLSCHLALLVKKIIGININVSHKYTDDTILGLLDKVGREFTSASRTALAILGKVKFEVNDHMIPEKTDELMNALKSNRADHHRGRSKAEHLVVPSTPQLAPKSPLGLKPENSHSMLGNGIFHVKQMQSTPDGKISFGYGPRTYILEYDQSVILPAAGASSTVKVINNRIVSATSR